MIAILSNADALFLAAAVPVIAGIGYNIWQNSQARKAADEAKTAAQLAAKEFKPNGGSSMRDSLDRLEKSVHGLHDGQANLSQRLGAVEDYITNPEK